MRYSSVPQPLRASRGKVKPASVIANCLQAKSLDFGDIRGFRHKL